MNRRITLSLLVGMGVMSTAGCGASGGSIRSLESLPPASSLPPATTISINLPTECPEPIRDELPGMRMGFIDAVLSSGSLTTVTIRSVEWVHPPEPFAMKATFGYLILDAIEEGTRKPMKLKTASQCADAVAGAAQFEPGARFAVLTQRYYKDQNSVLPEFWDVVSMWRDADWKQPVNGFLSDDGDFAEFAVSKSMAPFDLVRQWISAPDRRWEFSEDFSKWNDSRPWLNTDPFIRSLSARDVPGDMSSTLFQGQVSYDPTTLQQLEADFRNRVVLRTEDGVLAAAAVTGVGEFQWESQLPATSRTVSVWITSTWDLRGGQKIAEMKLTPLQHKDGAQLLVTITSTTSATIEPVR